MSSRRRKAGVVAASIVVLLVASIVVAGLILVYRPLATIDGEFRLLGLDQRSEVIRDSYGVPHIYAQTSHDLFYLQGYVTAQDRLFQMDLYRRAGAGRLAEVLGEPALDSDKQFRTFGLARVAAQELALLREDTRQNLGAYADGVNTINVEGFEVTILDDGRKVQIGSRSFDLTGPKKTLVIHQDVRLYLAKLGVGQTVRHELQPGRAAWLHVATGAATVNGRRLNAGDAIAVEDEPAIEVTGEEPGEVLLFDLA